MRRLTAIILAAALLLVPGCSATEPESKQASDNEGILNQSSTDTQIAQEKAEEDMTYPQELSDQTLDESDNQKEMNILIKIGERSFTATLYDNEATRALWDMLPETFPMMNLYGREMCYRMGNGALPDDTAEEIGYEIGDISYWPPAGSLVILYKQNGEVFEQVKIGHTDDDISFFNGMEDTEITFEKAE